MAIANRRHDQPSDYIVRVDYGLLNRCRIRSVGYVQLRGNKLVRQGDEPVGKTRLPNLGWIIGLLIAVSDKVRHRHPFNDKSIRRTGLSGNDIDCYVRSCRRRTRDGRFV